MAGSGISGQVGLKAESTYGTAVVVDTFVPFISESIQRVEEHIESEAIRAGRYVLTSDQWNGGNVMIEGDLALELSTKNQRPLLKQMFGTETGVGPYTYTPGELAGDSLTIQIGRPAVDGTVHPFTYAGCKFSSWEIACEAGQIATLTLSVMGKSETTAAALAAASYAASDLPFKFSGATLSIASVAVNTKQVTLSGDLALERRMFLGAQTTAEPLSTGLYTFDGSLQAEFESLTAYNRFVNGTEAALVLSFTRGSASLVITCNVRFDGETPNVGGRGIVEQPLPFKCVASSALDGSAITAVYTP